MAYFKREELSNKGPAFLRLQPDMKVVLGAGEIDHLQPLAQDKTDGKFYAYKKGDENRGSIAGLYMGEKITAEGGENGMLSTYIIVGKEDIKGIEWETDFTALYQLKVSGVIVTGKIEGKTEGGRI